MYLDHDAVDDTIEQTEGSDLLANTIREKLLLKLNDLGDPNTELITLFRQIDDDGATLGRQNFLLFLEAMGISISRKRWLQVYHCIDLTYDGQINYEELHLFLFPNTSFVIVSIL